MHGRLAAWGVLMASGLMSRTEYEARLHELFLAHPEDGLLLELEMISSDEKQSVARLLGLDGSVETALREILPVLEAAYRSGTYSLWDFSVLAHEVYRKLPRWLEDAAPLDTLSIIGDYIEICDEAHLRRICEQCFRCVEPGHPPIDEIWPTPVQEPRKNLLSRLFRRKR